MPKETLTLLEGILISAFVIVPLAVWILKVLILGSHIDAQITIVDKTKGVWNIIKAFFYYLRYPEKMKRVISLVENAVDTQSMYNTVSHNHLDSLVCWAMGEYPDAGLDMVECEDGRWFVEVDYGCDYDHLDGVSKPSIAPYIEPRFFSNEGAARDFAIECIKAVYPSLNDRNLMEWFEELFDS